MATTRAVWGLWCRNRKTAGSWEWAWGGQQVGVLLLRGLWHQPHCDQGLGLLQASALLLILGWDSGLELEAVRSVGAAPPPIRSHAPVKTMDLWSWVCPGHGTCWGLLWGQRWPPLISCSPSPYLIPCQPGPAHALPGRRLTEPVADKQDARSQVVASSFRSLWSSQFCLLLLWVTAEVRACLTHGPGGEACPCQQPTEG